MSKKYYFIHVLFSDGRFKSFREVREDCEVPNLELYRVVLSRFGFTGGDFQRKHCYFCKDCFRDFCVCIPSLDGKALHDRNFACVVGRGSLSRTDTFKFLSLTLKEGD